MQNFQTQVTIQPAPGEAGDFYGVNPRATVIAGPGQFVAPAGGLLVGNFAWFNTDTGAVSQSYVPGYQLGIVHRENNAIITQFLGEATLLIPTGLPVTAHSQGDFWARFAGGATPGQKVYADPGTGAPVAGGNSAPAITSFTGSVGASFTGVVAANVLTTSAVTGFLTPGDVVSGAGVANVVLGAQLTGPVGGAGTYTFVHADVSSEALTSVSNVLNVTAVVGGDKVEIGDVLTGTGVTGSPQITAQTFGTPNGVGRYTINGAAQRVAPTATLGAGAIATPWLVNSVAAAGEVAIISTWG